ncbi:MAG: peptide/nickel transport system permease protein [Clostridia bacterium]|jgi:peptide/nickel transport system permease protein|nr:binding-protein-dependent transport system inner rane component [Clostridiales bacterium]MDK2985046.1 peptide/nickel transport system permease protein [Clostridia bacterium]
MHVDYFNCVKKNNMGRMGLILLVIISTIAIFAPLLTFYHPAETSPNTLQFPSAKHPLGTNDIGQDILSRVLYGARTTLVVAFLVGITSTLLSAFLGGTAALFGGLYERIVMRIADVFLTLPSILVIILITSYVRPGLLMLVIVISAFSWQGGARVIRAQTLSLKNKAHIAAARTFGAGNLYILRKHILPDLGPLMVAGFVQHARRAVFMEAGLAFLGICDPTTVSWGIMLNRALEFAYLNVWYWLLPPGLALSLTVLSFTFLGYALEETVNPRLRVKENA